jgi:hypothetical protein
MGFILAILHCIYSIDMTRNRVMKNLKLYNKIIIIINGWELLRLFHRILIRWKAILEVSGHKLEFETKLN